MGEESSGTQPKVKIEQAVVQIRRWQDKAFGLLTTVILGLIGTVYGLHSTDIHRVDERAGGAERRIDGHAEKTKADLEKIQADQRTHAERIRALEENRGEINRRLEAIDKSLERQDVKHDQVNQKIDKLLERVK